jgi:hypothetical protein
LQKTTSTPRWGKSKAVNPSLNASGMEGLVATVGVRIR